MAKKFSIEWDRNADARANARKQLPRLADSYFRAGRKMLGGNHPPNAMHKFRLRTKRFRYTLELFREIYGPGIEMRLKMLKPLQDALGDLNDCSSALEVLGKHARGMREYLKRRAEKKVDEFEACWRGAFDAPGQSEDWMKYLAAGRRGK